MSCLGWEERRIKKAQNANYTLHFALFTLLSDKIIDGIQKMYSWKLETIAQRYEAFYIASWAGDVLNIENGLVAFGVFDGYTEAAAVFGNLIIYAAAWGQIGFILELLLCRCCFDIRLSFLLQLVSFRKLFPQKRSCLLSGDIARAICAGKAAMKFFK